MTVTVTDVLQLYINRERLFILATLWFYWAYSTNRHAVNRRGQKYFLLTNAQGASRRQNTLF